MSSILSPILGVALGALLLGPIGHRRRLALPAFDPDEAQSRTARDLACQRNDARARRHTGPIHADIDFDHDAQTLAGLPEGGIELRDVLHAVDADDRIGAI